MDSRKGDAVNKWFQYPAITLALLMVSIPTLVKVMGAVDGQIWPAAAPMVLHEARPADREGWTDFDGASARLRPGCSFQRLEWFRGGRDGQNVPIAVRLGRPQNRPNGDFTFKGWSANIAPPYDFETDTFSDAIHQCRLFWTLDENGRAVGGVKVPWLTRTHFYDPKGE
jgi:hypothetical protein